MSKAGSFLTNGDLIREIYPITSAIAYGKKCYQMIRTAKQPSRAIRPKRGNIVSLSRKSLIQLMFTMQCTKVDFTSMITFTYPAIYPQSGQIVKEDVNVMTQKLRRLGWSYVWFLEFQTRGAPHLHFLLTAGGITPRARCFFGLFWAERIALSEWFLEKCPPEKYTNEVIKVARVACHTKTWEMFWLEEGARNYATSYAAKEKQKTVPKKFRDVGRFWGASRDVRPKGTTFDVTEEEIEQWLVEHGHPAQAYEFVPKYVWGVGESKPKKETQVWLTDGQDNAR